MADYTPENIKTKSREELKEIAVSYGISNGYHGRSISKMRKSDYIDYICESLVTPTSSPTRNNLSEDSSDTPAFNAGVSQVPPNAPLRRGRTRNPQNSSPTQAEMGNPALARVPARVPGEVQYPAKLLLLKISLEKHWLNEPQYLTIIRYKSILLP
jgi:hypothetical protein